MITCDFKKNPILKITHKHVSNKNKHPLELAMQYEAKEGQEGPSRATMNKCLCICMMKL